MFRPAKTRWPFTALIAVLIFISHNWVFAQAGTRLRVSKPDTSQFPEISLSLAITDDTGRHIPNLSAPNITILEDGETIGIDTLDEVIVGTRQIFIINSSRGLRGRDALGLTRYDYVRRELIEWWARSDAAAIGIDDLSLMSLEGNLVIHSALAAELSSALNAYEPDFEEEFATITPLLQALEFSSDILPRPGMPTLIFFITPLITESQELPLANTITWAKENGISIYPILVGPIEILEFPQIDNLGLLAEATGGEMILFDSELGLTSLADHILTRRMLYEISYTSKVNSTGSHNLQIRVTSDGVDVISDPASFSMNISPPEVILLQSPDRIIRETDDPGLLPEAIHPTSTTVEILVMFPDGYPRQIVSSQLIVDNQVVEIHTQPPFDTFEWDISQYKETSSHDIKVVVEDSLGLQGTAVGMPVSIEVITPASGFTSFLPELGPLLPIGGAVIIVIVFSVMIIMVARRRGTGAPSTSQDSRRRADQRRSFGLGRRADRALVEAMLNPVTKEMPLISLIGMDLVLGRDASISAAHLDDPSVNALHARLIRLASGDYLLRDQGSVAGTWVNYQQVPERGRILRHGDVIHLGRVEYQFQLRNPPPESRIHVELVHPSLSDVSSEDRGIEEPT